MAPINAQMLEHLILQVEKNNTFLHFILSQWLRQFIQSHACWYIWSPYFQKFVLCFSSFWEKQLWTCWYISSPYFQKHASCFSSFLGEKTLKFNPLFFGNLIQGSGIAFYVSSIHSITMYVVPLERAWKDSIHSKYTSTFQKQGNYVSMISEWVGKNKDPSDLVTTWSGSDHWQKRFNTRVLTTKPVGKPGFM